MTKENDFRMTHQGETMTDQPQLLTAHASQLSRIGELEEKLGACMVACKTQRQRIKELEKKQEIAKEALRWYAETRTWQQWLPDAAGDRARAALRELGVSH